MIMMPIKYIGKTFDEEVDVLIGTLCNLPLDYTRYDVTPNILHFDTEKEAQDALVHLNHFVFSCLLAEPVLDGPRIEFIMRPTVPPTKAFERKRNAYIRKLFKSQLKNLERMLDAEFRVYRRRGRFFQFRDQGGMITVKECLTLDPTPSSRFGFGILEYVQTAPLSIEVVCRKDIPYGTE